MVDTLTTSSLVAGIIAEFIGFLFLAFKTLPVHENRLTRLESGLAETNEYRRQMEDRLQMLTRLEEKMLAMTRESDMKFEAMRRTFEENRETTKEITRHLQRAVEDNVRAIVSLEATMKQLGTRL